MKAEDELRKQMFLKAQDEQKHRDLDRLNHLLQAAHMATTMSMSFFSEAEEILERNQIVLDNVILQKQREYQVTADMYCKEFATMIKTDLEKKHFWENLEEIEKKFRRWAGLNNAEVIEWHKVAEMLPKAGEKVIVATCNGKYALSEVGADKEWKGSGTFVDSIVAWRPIEKFEIEEQI